MSINVCNADNIGCTNGSNFAKIIEKEYGVILDVKYATKDNFTGRVLHKNPVVYLHVDTAQRLLSASRYAKAIGYKLKIFDGYRPLDVQRE